MIRIVSELLRSDFTKLILLVPPGCRPFVIAAAFVPTPPTCLDQAFDLAKIRIALAEQWERAFSSPMPIAQCQALLGNPAAVPTWIELGRFITARTDEEIAYATYAVLTYFRRETS